MEIIILFKIFLYSFSLFFFLNYKILKTYGLYGTLYRKNIYIFFLLRKNIFFRKLTYISLDDIGYSYYFKYKRSCFLNKNSKKVLIVGNAVCNLEQIDFTKNYDFIFVFNLSENASQIESRIKNSTIVHFISPNISIISINKHSIYINSGSYRHNSIESNAKYKNFFYFYYKKCIKLLSSPPSSGFFAIYSAICSDMFSKIDVIGFSYTKTKKHIVPYNVTSKRHNFKKEREYIRLFHNMSIINIIDL